MDRPNVMPSFHGSRFIHDPSYTYYAFGNTPAQNLLEYVPSGVGEPSVLLLGCGDIRSCLLTIWKNFDPDFKHRFRGVHFVLNDKSAAVIARDIIFLYLCLNTPENQSERKDWILAMWSIWFCHELLPAHNDILQNAIKALLHVFSDKNSACSSSDHPLLSLVHCISPDTAEKIKNVWNHWCSRGPKVTSIESMRSARKMLLDIFYLDSVNRDNKARAGTHDAYGMLGVGMFYNYESMVKEYRSYIDSGNAFGESLFVFGNGPTKEKTSVNLTLFEREDGEYTFDPGACPFKCFPHMYLLNIDSMISSGMHVPSSVKNGPRVNSKAFKQAPLLANSFQQFSIWVSSTAKVLQNYSANISFMFDVSDVFDFFQLWIESSKKLFDLIFATNVMDNVSPPAFVLAAVRLLTDTGSFLSSTMRFTLEYSTFEEYIAAVFGFKSELLPVICGIRCVNHEGLSYSSPVSPTHLSNVTDGHLHLSLSREKILIWKKVSADSLIIDSLKSHLHICEQLADCFLACCYELNQYNSCTDTAIEVLKTFATRLSQTDLVRSHEFWEGLCSRLLNMDDLKLFQTSIQTQALAKGLHLHLVVDEHTCPTCNDLPLFEYLGLFCIETQVQSYCKSHYFLVRLDKSQSITFRSHIQYLDDRNSQYIDCISVVCRSRTLKLYFLAPLSFSKGSHCLSLFRLTHGFQPTSVILGSDLSGYLVDSPLFSLPKHWPPSESSACKYSSSLGTLTDHCGSEDRFESKLSLIKDDLPALLTGDIQVEQTSSTEFVIQCLNRSVQIRYPYPVSNSSLIIEHSKELGTLTVKAKREPHRYEEEGQLFHVNPEDHFSLVPYAHDGRSLETILKSQYTRNEKNAIPELELSLISPIFKVKRILVLLLKFESDGFFRLVLPEGNVLGLVKIINRVIDVHRRTHAIDLCFCFLDALDETTSKYICGQLDQVSFQFNDLFLYSEAYDLLKKVFNNFAAHSLQSAAKYPLSSNPPDLSRCKIEGHFRRAVVYPLYPDSAFFALELQNAVTCCHCEERVDKQYVQKCTKCKNASYCSRQCREEDWSEHKRYCKEVCSFCYCQAGPQGLKKCGGCMSVSYCDKQCQTDDWKAEHKLHCKKSLATTSSGSSLQPAEFSKGRTKPASVKKRDFQPQRIQEKRQIKQDMVLEEVIEQSDQQHTTDCEVLGVEQCSYCQQQSPHLKHCLRCYKALYYRRECQHAHWNKHKRECCISDASVPISEVCSYCKSEAGPEGFKNCLGCEGVSYCSKQCQIDHWKVEHHLLCTKSLSLSSGPSLVPDPPTDKKYSSKLISSEKSDTQPSSRREKYQVSEDVIKQVDQPKQPTDYEILGVEQCSYCHQQSPHLKHCSRCYKALYCGGECQHAHWRKHKRKCKKIV